MPNSNPLGKQFKKVAYLLLACAGVCSLGGAMLIPASADENSGQTQTSCSLDNNTIEECFPDPKLASAVAAMLNKSETAVFTTADSQIDSSVNLNRAGISNLEGIQLFTRVTNLVLDNNKITDISPLASMTQLTSLSLGTNTISDITPLKSLTNLTWLRLSNNQITDVSPLASLSDKLTSLDLIWNQISDASPLGSLTNINDIDVSLNSISDASPFANLTKMTSFQAYGNQITDPAPFANLTKLNVLNLRGNYIGDLSHFQNFSGLPNLYTLSLLDQRIVKSPLLEDKTKTYELTTGIVNGARGIYAPVTEITPEGGTYEESLGKVIWPTREAGNHFVDFSYDGTLPTGESYTYSGWVGQTVSATVTVTYDSQGGSEVPSQVLPVEGVIGNDKPADPVRDGYIFTGWTKDKEGKDPFDFDTPILTDLTLYGQWKVKDTTVPKKPEDKVPGTTTTISTGSGKGEEPGGGLVATGTSTQSIALLSLGLVAVGNLLMVGARRFWKHQ